MAVLSGEDTVLRLPLGGDAVANVEALPLSFTVTAHAEAPAAKQQAPGWYRTKVGDIEVTALLDTTAKLPLVSFMVGAPKEQLSAGMQKHFLTDEPELSVTAYLVNTGGKLVLIDTGLGTGMGSTPMLLDEASRPT